jgi:hypothetical protein
MKNYQLNNNAHNIILETFSNCDFFPHSSLTRYTFPQGACRFEAAPGFAFQSALRAGFPLQSLAHHACAAYLPSLNYFFTEILFIKR